LFQNGREEEAFDFLIRYHGDGDVNNAIVQLEMTEFRGELS